MFSRNSSRLVVLVSMIMLTLLFSVVYSFAQQTERRVHGKPIKQVVRNGKQIEYMTGIIAVRLAGDKSQAKQQLDQLRKDYGALKTINPSSSSYKKLEKLMNNLPISALKQIAGAKIKFVSMLANARVMNPKKGNNVNESLKSLKLEGGTLITESLSQSDILKVYSTLNKGDEVEIDRKDGFKTYVVTKGKTKVGKRKVERITLVLKDKLKAVKYYLYNRDNYI